MLSIIVISCDGSTDATLPDPAYNRSGDRDGSRRRGYRVALPIILTDFSASTKLEVAIKGTLTCRTDSTAAKPKAFSMSLSMPAMRLEF